MSDKNFWGMPLSPCGDTDCRNGLRPLHYGDEHEWDICDACEALPKAYVHPEYPF